MAGKTVWDLVSDIFQRHGLATIMLLFIGYMYWENHTYERANDKILEATVKQVAAEVSVISYKVNDIDKSVDRLENKVFFTVDRNGDGIDDDEQWVITDYTPKDIKQ